MMGSIGGSLERDPEDMSALINSACLYAKAGLKEAALEFLERSFARGWGKRDWVEHDPDYDILRTTRASRSCCGGSSDPRHMSAAGRPWIRDRGAGSAVRSGPDLRNHARFQTRA